MKYCHTTKWNKVLLLKLNQNYNETWTYSYYSTTTVNHVFGRYFCFQQLREDTFNHIQWGLCKKNWWLKNVFVWDQQVHLLHVTTHNSSHFSQLKFNWTFPVFFDRYLTYYPFALSRLLHILAVLINRNLQARLVFGVSQIFSQTLISTTPHHQNAKPGSEQLKSLQGHRNLL